MNDDLKKWIDSQALLNKLYVHDFKNPVSAVAANMSYLEAVIDDADEDLKGAVTDSNVAVRMLLHMIDNFLNISRLEMGEKLEPVAVPLNKFIIESIDKCESLFAVMEPSVTMKTLIPDTMCYWPPVYAKVAFENLLLSCIHNTPSSGKVMLGVAVVGESVVIKIEDNGVQIREDYFDKTFQREFQMVAKTDENARYGRAMAMYAVELAASYLGGSVAVKRENGDQFFELIIPKEMDV